MALTRQARNEVVNNNTRPKGQGKERLKNEMFVCVCGRRDQDKELPKCHPLHTVFYLHLRRSSLIDGHRCLSEYNVNIPHNQGMLEEIDPWRIPYPPHPYLSHPLPPIYSLLKIASEYKEVTRFGENCATFRRK